MILRIQQHHITVYVDHNFNTVIEVSGYTARMMRLHCRTSTAYSRYQYAQVCMYTCTAVLYALLTALQSIDQ